MADTIYGFNEDGVNRINRALDKSERDDSNIGGDTSNRRGLQPERGFWGKVTSSTIITTGHRQYTYGITKQQRKPIGSPSLTPWQDHPDGFTCVANNSIEAYNTTGAVVLGNSIDHSASNYPSTDWHLPVRGNPVVWVRGEYASDGSYVYTFQYVNGEQGVC